ncbi:MAG: energy transducer TonB [Syntrophaceae bacterium]|nr:energy transducer TonB [Syntrophaceae bacterium]
MKRNTLFCCLVVLILSVMSCGQKDVQKTYQKVRRGKYYVKVLRAVRSDMETDKKMKPDDSDKSLAFIFFETNDPELQPNKIMEDWDRCGVLKSSSITVYSCGGGSAPGGTMCGYEIPKSEEDFKLKLKGYPAIPIYWEPDIEEPAESEVIESFKDSELNTPLSVKDEEMDLEPDAEVVVMDTEEKDDAVVSYTYDVAPNPIGGMTALQQRMVYPEAAKNAGIEGRVLVQAMIGTDSTVQETKILKSLTPETDQSAVSAITSVRWSPALKNDKPVNVWIMIPIDFRLR